ncbi:helix-turn-helix transcriptional regulator [Streptomyces noursei]|uniref:helix-turn-helix transcriptional regulator n=1 Tax=Streptomyces noursei TaxID=1971 RepID=UPI00380CB8D9
MARHLLVVQCAKVRSLRQDAGMSVQELADRVGVTPRMVMYWEDGTCVPEARNARRLCDALRCSVADLTEAVSGTETLAHLRFSCGLTAEDAASRLRDTSAGRALFVDAHKIRCLERGRRVSGWNWRKPECTGRLVKELATVYGAPVRMVLDAWMRTRPGDICPAIPDEQQPSPPASALARWAELNDRQRVYLEEFLRDDEMTEAEMWMRKQNGSEVPPARQWRKMPFSVHAPVEVFGFTRLQQRLRAQSVHDQGAGATLGSLERLGLITVSRDTVEVDGIGAADRTLVEMTRRGRACARAGRGEPPATKTPEHLLSEWLWGTLSRVIATGDEGVHESALTGKSLFFLAVGYRPQRGAHPSRGFIELRPLMADGDTHVVEYRWHATSLGRRHADEYRERYARLYPTITTP